MRKSIPSLYFVPTNKFRRIDSYDRSRDSPAMSALLDLLRLSSAVLIGFQALPLFLFLGIPRNRGIRFRSKAMSHPRIRSGLGTFCHAK